MIGEPRNRACAEEPMPLLSCPLLPSLFFSLVLLNHYILAQMGSLASTAQADRPKKKKADRDGTLTRVGYLIGSRSTDRQKKDDLKDLQVRLVDVHYSGLCIIMQSPVSSLLCTLHLFSIPSYALLLYGVVYSSIVVYYTDRYRTSCRLPDLARRGWRPGGTYYYRYCHVRSIPSAKIGHPLT